MRNCVICKKPESKYKCPICVVYYCSVGCCNNHRKKKCKLVKQQEEQPSVSDEISSKYEFETDDTVPLKKLKLIEQDKDLNNILGNPHLRNLLTTIDSSKEPKEIMQKAMLEPIFVEFADACLKLVKPSDGSPDNAIVETVVESQSDN